MPETLLDAVAKIYGLQIVPGTDDTHPTLHLSRRRIGHPLSLAALPEEIEHIIPEPIVRAYRAQHPLFHPHTPEEMRTMTKEGLPENAMRFAALKRFRTFVEPELSSVTTDKRITLALLKEPEKQALAVFFFTGILSSLDKMVSVPVPDYVAHPENVSLIGSFYTINHKNKLEVAFAGDRKINQGHVFFGTGTGISGIDYTGDPPASLKDIPERPSNEVRHIK